MNPFSDVDTSEDKKQDSRHRMRIKNKITTCVFLPIIPLLHMELNVN